MRRVAAIARRLRTIAEHLEVLIESIKTFDFQKYLVHRRLAATQQ